MVVFICVFPAYWATGMLGQHRTLNVAYLFFLVFWFINLTVWVNYYSTTISNTFTLFRTKFFLPVIIFGLVFTGNGYSALDDIFSGKAIVFDKQNSQRINRLQKANNYHQKELRLKPILAKPKCLFTYDISNDPKDWKNQAYNMYFRLDSLDILLKDE